MTAGQQAGGAAAAPAQRVLAQANLVMAAVAARRTRTLGAGCGQRPCRCVSVTPAELAAVRAALSVATTGAAAEGLVLGHHNRGRVVEALHDGACWRRLSAYALCHICHRVPGGAVGMCGHNRADLDAAAAYEGLAGWLSALPGWVPAIGTGDARPAGVTLDEDQAAAVHSALEDASGHIRERAAHCPECATGKAGVCAGCADRLSRAEVYDALAEKLGEVTR